ncbi:MAG: SMC-Scp complex subunit ScpB [Candidatus Altiarchaeales archaeon]|nr:SMC-Scp complex subunit ScpB [Candidatus Altiarchaeales archaeon]
MLEEKSYVEAALFVSSDPVKASQIAKTLGLGKKEVEKYLTQLKQEYQGRDSAIEVVNTGVAWVMKPKKIYEEKIVPLIPETDLKKPMLKTLALIAYEQPIKQSYVVKIRGTRAYQYIPKLVELGLVEARKKGNTKILSTTPKFKQYFRLKEGQKLVKNEA